MDKILIVDDDRSFAEMIRTFLEDDYEVITARSGEECLEKIEEEEPDLVLLDLMMPGMDGWDVQSRIEATHPDVKIALISALDKNPDLSQKNIEDFILKKRPFTKRYLLRRIRRII